jgi:hypothetical protein
MYITKHNVEKIAIEKYRKNGLGITFEDIKRRFSVNKTEAQRKLKYFHGRDVLFTAKDITFEAPGILENKSPQRYFPTRIKAEIIEGKSKRKNVQVNPTGVDLLAPPSSKLTSAISDDSDIVTNTLEGYVLPLLPQAPIFIDNLHFKTQVPSECYLDLDLPYYEKNKGKNHSENIGTLTMYFILMAQLIFT